MKLAGRRRSLAVLIGTTSVMGVGIAGIAFGPVDFDPTVVWAVAILVETVGVALLIIDVLGTRDDFVARVIAPDDEDEPRFPVRAELVSRFSIGGPRDLEHRVKLLEDYASRLDDSFHKGLRELRDDTGFHLNRMVTTERSYRRELAEAVRGQTIGGLPIRVMSIILILIGIALSASSQLISLAPAA